MKRIVYLQISILVALGIAKVDAEVLTFDEIPYQKLTSFTASGVTFTYSGYGDAFIGDPVGPSRPMNYITPAWLVGDARGSLNISLSTPSSLFGFGYALNGYPGSIITDGIRVTLFDALGASLGDFSYDLNSPAWSPEGRFDYSGSSEISSALLTFRSDYTYYGWNPLFGIDNVTYTSAAIPEPALYSLVFGLFFGLYAYGVRRRRDGMKVSN